MTALGCHAAQLHIAQDKEQTPPIQEVKNDYLFSGERAFALLKAQCDIGPRYPGSEGHSKMLEWLITECKKYTSDVVKQEFEHRWSQTGKVLKMSNVIAKMDFGKKKTVLLLAHWDTRPFADQDPNPNNRRKPIIGANDGASGVAVLLELMRVFKQTPPGVNIVFLFTDGEDLGPGLDEMFLGAAHFAKNMKKGDYEYGILLDMVGDKNLRIPKEPNSLYYARELVERIWKHAKSMGYEKYFPNEVQMPIMDDHIPLNEAGLPTIDIIDFDYPYWHTLEDTPDKCSPDSLGIVGRVLESFLKQEK